jgi:hypothetical protein
MDLVFAPSQIESWPIYRLHPYARNAKMHGEDRRQYGQVLLDRAVYGG